MSAFRTAAIFKGALLGGVAAGALDVGLFLVGKTVGAKFVVVQKGGALMPIPAFMPMVNCVMGALVAAAVMAGLAKLAGDRAFRIFLGVAALVFAGYFALPFLALQGDMTSIAFLEVMHVPAAVGIVGGIWRANRSSGG